MIYTNIFLQKLYRYTGIYKVYKTYIHYTINLIKKKQSNKNIKDLSVM